LSLSQKKFVMAGLVRAIHVFLSVEFFKVRMPGTSPGMTPNYFDILPTQP